MKIFSWMQSKLNAKQGSGKQNSVSANHQSLQEPAKEEFIDWPHGLLSIGTFGNTAGHYLQGREASCQDILQDMITPEESGELQKELKLVSVDESSSLDELEASLEIDVTTNNLVYEDVTTKESPIQCSSSILGRAKESRADSANNAIGKKSMSFLLKRMFLCRSVSTPSPYLKDSLPQSRLEKSRMEKIFRAMLNKKIYPQSGTPNATTAAKKHLQNQEFCMTDSDDEMSEAANGGSKWDKTDSDFIVLEI